uniref:Uncharacterized protein n=1 Tax=Setaria viridis TaxID=4556 RepID=A0A4U6U0B1_SETVI|nr:hypothetical protein SEVIR_7G022800v2 [Setaria viridis]
MQHLMTGTRYPPMFPLIFTRRAPRQRREGISTLRHWLEDKDVRLVVCHHPMWSSMYSAGDAQMVCSNKQNKVNPRVIINIAGHTGSTCSVQIYY